MDSGSIDSVALYNELAVAKMILTVGILHSNASNCSFKVLPCASYTRVDSTVGTILLRRHLTTFADSLGLVIAPGI